MTAELSDDDRGKAVVHGTERIGVVTDVRGDTAYVDPVLDHVPQDLRETLDWREDADEYTLDESAITAVVNTQVRLRDDI
ncbi:MAG: PRC-barrel domain containing protein [Salinigranum sp.]